MNHYIVKDKKKLRCGYTTGSCAAGATKAALEMLLGRELIPHVKLMTPEGIELLLDVEGIQKDEEKVSCAIRKDGGDDPDVTHGLLIYAEVKKSPQGITIKGGKGVGRVTRPGLDQPIGEAAINTTPREMIQKAVVEVCHQYQYTEGIEVILSIPEGEEVAQKTFNPRLGIEGGLSILGTTGIVEPMSEKALIDTIAIEMQQYVEEGNKIIFLTPGNYGLQYLQTQLGMEGKRCIKCSNYIGEALDKAMTLKPEGLILVGHIGKLVKVSVGMMNTHSKWADARMEALAACYILAGGTSEGAKALLHANTTDEALGILATHHLLEETMKVMIAKITYHLQHRVGHTFPIEVIVFSNTFGILGETEGATKLLLSIRESM